MDLGDLRNGLTVADLLSLAGMAVVVSIVIELAKRTLAWTEEFTKRFAPITGCLVGMALSVLASLYLQGDAAQAALTGFLAGALAAGVYDVAVARVIAILGGMVPKGTP